MKYSSSKIKTIKMFKHGEFVNVAINKKIDLIFMEI